MKKEWEPRKQLFLKAYQCIDQANPIFRHEARILHFPEICATLQHPMYRYLHIGTGKHRPSLLDFDSLDSPWDVKLPWTTAIESCWVYLQGREHRREGGGGIDQLTWLVRTLVEEDWDPVR